MIDALTKAWEKLADYIEANPGYEILFPILLGIVTAWIIYIVKCSVYGRFFHQLKKLNAVDEDSAKTFEELGIIPGKKLKSSLKKENKGIRNIVSVTEEGKYYIEERKQSKAIYDSKECSPVAIVLQLLALCALVFLLMKAVPIVIENVGNIDLSLPSNTLE